ncbi:MAG: DUF6622 family protein [Pseudomonadota bacterium]
MLQQILIHTPVYVWAILAFLLYRGIVASADRAVTVNSLLIIPAVMLWLSLQEIARNYGFAGLPLAAWAAGAAASAAVTWRLIDGRRIEVDVARGIVLQRGSWVPLALMLGIFCSKYALGVTFALQPALRHDSLVVLGTCLLFGMFNGIFLGRLARNMAAFHASYKGIHA